MLASWAIRLKIEFRTSIFLFGHIYDVPLDESFECVKADVPCEILHERFYNWGSVENFRMEHSGGGLAASDTID